MLTQKQISVFQEKILEWFTKNKRDLPWRHSRDPYNILISEVMLQQTQVPRVIPKFADWMKQFPTVVSLANASPRDVLLFWSGLGYNRRALYLKKLAEILIAQYNGQFPQDEKQLLKLPGIGEYTARALLCFAYDEQVAVVDTNIRKVILTEFKEFAEDTPKVIQEIANKLLPKGKAYEWNQALMDYASAELKKEKIPIPRQSYFKTSNRFYRGQIVRLLLHGQETIDLLFTKIKNNGITKEQFDSIITGMENDGLLIRENNTIMLPQE